MKNRFLLFVLASSLIFIHSCQKEHSFEGGAGPSEGVLQDGGTGDCLPKTVAGTYVAGTVLDGTTNYIEVQVDVTLAGSYVIITDTANGIWFRGTGVFTSTGLNTVRLRGNGTPTAEGVHNFIVSYGASGCSIAVTTAGSLATFTLGGAPGTCTGATPAGTYMVGTSLTSANTVNINVNVTALGAYSLSSSTSNGMTFTGAGVFTTLGSQDVVLTGSGTPGTAGSTTIPVISGAASCGFVVTVDPAAAAAVYVLDCASAVVNGTYTQGVALGASNTVTITANVTTVGPYTVTGTFGGMTFSGSGTFAGTGNQTITLTATGTPTTSGSNAVPLTGGTTGCNLAVPVVGGAGAATFTIDCVGATVNGTYTVGAALGAANTVSLPAAVTVAGTYNVTGTLNGMSFSGSGTFAGTGNQTILLTAIGTPTTAGANPVPLTGATAGCNLAITVAPAAGGAAVYMVNCASANINGIYTEGVALTASNTISLSVNVTTAGTYTITTTANNGMTFTSTGTLAVGVQTITLTGTGTPAADGTFTIAVPAGTVPCTFDLDVSGTTQSLGTWSFNEGATNYSGTFSDAGFDNTSIPNFSLFYMVGETAAGHYLELGLVDFSTVINNGEVYSCATFTGTANTGVLYFEGPPPASPILYEAYFQIVPNTMSFTVTTHNVATKTITGTFAGTAQDEGGAIKTITNGTFTVTYP
jgi:hypothetical protein